ncbi:MAG TPA: hypothetical protein VEV84_09210, partial [Pyrinomonadaceae bacterium]|nr:hypothetical protein [Pyrinomonadaceae bacterium]
SQIALIPVWMGICLVLGFPGTTDSGEIGKHVLSVLVNIVTIIISSLTVYIAVYGLSPSLSKILGSKRTAGGTNRKHENFRRESMSGAKIQ